MTGVTSFDIKGIAELAKQRAEPFEQLTREIGRVIVGQEDMIRKLLIGLLSDGHVLLEGVPGLAKTTAVSCLARGIQVGFQRIQFTPDLLPADLTGTQIYHPNDGSFSVKKGPIFSNIVLADEINRAPAKVQSALLEAMQERQVTIGEETFMLPRPFLVLATQNPIEQEGTYPLPEAQVDRFMLKLVVTYPSKTEEREILERMGKTQVTTEIRPVLSPSEIDAAREVIDQIYIDDKIKDYIVDLVTAGRAPEQYAPQLKGLIGYGASPRATIYLAITAKVSAFLAGRGYVVPQDVKDMAPEVLRHRIIITYEAEAEEMTSDDVVKILLDHVPVP
jgi:MoxR-like ATPase